MRLGFSSMGKSRKQALKETYWELRAALPRLARLLHPANANFAYTVGADAFRFFVTNTRPVEGETRARAIAAAGWLARAQDATPDDGVSHGYFPCHVGTKSGWRDSYPETTGYIIPSLLQYAERYGDEAMRDRAFRMAIWETEIQLPSGAVQGGILCAPEKRTPAVFNTGMVLQGYTAALLNGNSDIRIAQAARRAADFLVADMNDDGHFRTHGDFVAEADVKTYNCLCAWALYRFGVCSGDEQYQKAALRAIAAAVGEQKDNGWFARNCLTHPEAPLTHTIGYTLQGILEVALLAGRDDYLDVARKGIEPLVDRISERGFIHGRFFADWTPASRSSCLTGNAQLAIVLYRLYEATSQLKYRESADKLVNFLKGLQITDSSNPALNGAIAGSFPILGSYMTTGYPNWATKYFLDSLMLQDQLSANR